MPVDFNIDKSKNNSKKVENVEIEKVLKPEKYKPINKQDLYVL